MIRYLWPYLVCMSLLLSGCSGITVDYDFDAGQDFTRMRTYDWLPMPEKTKMDVFSVKRIKRAVERELAAKGLSRSRETPDFLIALHGGRRREVDIVEWGYAYAPHGYYHGSHRRGRRYYGGGPRYYEYRRGIDAYAYEVGTLILDFVDADSRELIWRGSAEAVMDISVGPERREKKINKAVGMVLMYFPPVEMPQ
jgi:hypothetical protein